MNLVGTEATCEIEIYAIRWLIAPVMILVVSFNVSPDFWKQFSSMCLNG